MTSIENAVLFDARDQPIEAAQAYEQVIAEGEADLTAYLNLAVLYFVSNDGGYAAHHNLPLSFISTAWDRAFALPDEAVQRFGPHPEIKFWRRYFEFILLGGEPFYPECERLVETGATPIPIIHLVFRPNRERYKQQTEALRQRVSAGLTVKERYIKSVLESAVLS